MKKLGCVNAAGIAKLFDKNGTQVGTCMDTPNAIAWCLGSGKGAYAKSFDGSTPNVDADRIAGRGWLKSAESAVYKKV